MNYNRNGVAGPDYGRLPAVVDGDSMLIPEFIYADPQEEGAEGDELIQNLEGLEPRDS